MIFPGSRPRTNRMDHQIWELGDVKPERTSHPEKYGQQLDIAGGSRRACDWRQSEWISGVLHYNRQVLTCA